MRRWAIVNTLFGVIVALVGFEIVRTWTRGLPRGAPAESAASTAPASPPAPEPHEKGKRGRGDKAGTLAQQTPALLVAAIADKDLFDPSRRPPSVEDTTTVAVPVTKPPDNVTVVGVRILGKDREAFVSDGTQGQAITRRVRTGDQIAGYTVKAIERTAVTLTSPSGDVVSMPLTLDAGKAQPSGQRPPIPARPPIPGRPPQPAGAQAGSPAAGVQGPSPAAGLGGRPPVPVAPQPAVGAPPKPGVATPLPAQVQQKLDQLKQNDKRRRH
jgi:hypothetical protein